jgi:hypothetical protein
MNSQAFKLFEKDKSLIYVAIELNLTQEEVSNIHSKYLILKNRQHADSILREHENELEPFVKIFNILKEKKINMNDFISKIDLTNDINNLKSEKEQLELDIFNLAETKKYWQLEIKETKNKFYNLQNGCS